ncbi:hypothetical protein ACW66K_06400 [Aerococcus urinaeequi]|uniref:Competence protein ComGF n=1 Tax=Aerococcus viridans TaxID=1377 RepID=A0A2N6UEG2_9LACT|nr:MULTISPECIES: hypothetical protein [Aerococcus]OFU48798.1 hypothetical protein HMPREF3116_07675 [Aerococcus sp. HMSC10H05]PMC79993.1 hypothetical protein CJ191_03355 [Aerococcus viridans]
MRKRGFILYTSLLFMSILTIIYLVNLSMYSSQIKLNEEIHASYQAQILSRLAVEHIIAKHSLESSKRLEDRNNMSIDESKEIEKEMNGAKIDSNDVNQDKQLDEKDNITNETILANGEWTKSFNKGSVYVELKNGQFNTRVKLVKNSSQYTYKDIPYDRRKNK